MVLIIGQKIFGPKNAVVRKQYNTITNPDYDPDLGEHPIYKRDTVSFRLNASGERIIGSITDAVIIAESKEFPIYDKSGNQINNYIPPLEPVEFIEESTE